MRLFFNFHDQDLEICLDRLEGGEEGVEEELGSDDPGVAADGPCEEDGLGEDGDSKSEEEEGIREEVDGLGGGPTVICCALAVISS